MTSVERQNIEIPIELNQDVGITENTTDKEQESPVVITLVRGQSGTLYRSQSGGNGIPDKLLYE